MSWRQPCVYILASRFNGTLYIGVTSDLIGRLIQHRSGRFRGFTNRYGVYLLVWFEMAETTADAIAAEKRIKKWPRDYKKNLIERANPHWEDLAVGLGLPPLGGVVAVAGSDPAPSCRARPGIHPGEAADSLDGAPGSTVDAGTRPA